MIKKIALLVTGLFVFSADFQQTLQLAKAGNVNAEVQAAYLYTQEYNFKEAYKWYSKAAKKGDVKALNSLGLLYLQGLGVRKNYQEAKRYFEIAAKKGHAPAELNLGYMYFQGHGIRQNYKMAYVWFKKAADQNNAAAIYNMGSLYMEGYGVEKNYHQSMIYYKKSAMLGNPHAFYRLGKLYQQGGPGLKQNYSEAYKWFMLASDHGNAEAQNALQVLKQKMTAAQVQQGEKLYQDYLNS